jgi:hypothetical protein
MLRRLRKPAVMAVVAGALALSLTVTTTQKAEANPLVALPVVAAAESIVGGASLPFVAPSLLSIAIATNPVGWAIGGTLAVAAIGVGLYATRDYWMPWVQDPLGSWGKATGANPSAPAGSGALVWPGLTTTGLNRVFTSSGGIQVAEFNMANTQPPTTGNNFVGWAVKVHCKNSDNSVTTYDKSTASGYSTLSAFVVQWTCNYSSQAIVGVMVGAYGSDPAFQASCPGVASNCRYNGPANVYRWGDFLNGGGTPAFDPRGANVKYKTTSECVDAGGVKTTITAESIGTDGAVKFASCEAAGKGHGTGNLSVVGIAPGTTTETPLWQMTPTADPAMPLCDPQRPGSGCKMTITIDSKPCTVGTWECEHWTDLYKDPATKPRVGCTYGPYTLEVDQCKVMEPAYRPGGAPATDANIDGDPATQNNTQPSGNQYTAPGSPTVPGGAATGAPAGSTPEEQQCFPQGWAMLNPVEWVMKPVGCALKAAFVPSKDVQTRVTGMQAKFSDKVPISWFGGSMTGVSGGSCPTNWALDVAGEHVSLICGTPAEGILLTFRPIMGAMLVIAALWPLIRSLFYAAIPIFKVTPS